MFFSFDLLLSCIVTDFYLAIEDNRLRGSICDIQVPLYLYATLSTTGSRLFIVAVHFILIESLHGCASNIMLLDNFLIKSLLSSFVLFVMFNQEV